MVERDLSRETLGIRAYFLGETEVNIAHAVGRYRADCGFAGGEAY